MLTRVSIVLLLLTAVALADDAKPKLLVLPLAGDAKPAERDRAAAAIRAKIDRQAVYEPLDQFTSAELVEGKQITAATSPDDVLKLAADASPTVLIWGELGAGKLTLNVLDTRTSKTTAVRFSETIEHATDIRFAVEKLIEQLPGSRPHEHMTEVAVVRDEQAERLWKEGPNLFKEGAFDAPGEWHGILADKKWSPPVQDGPPEPDGVVIRKAGKEQFLQMKLTRATAESYGLACLSGAMPIEPKTRYRISFRYRSDGPVIRPFIKGYIQHDGAEREIYRRQVPPRGETKGEWVEVVDEMNPQHQTFPPTSVRVDFYVYLTAGTVEFDDVIIKAVGAQTRAAKDEAMDQPVR